MIDTLSILIPCHNGRCLGLVRSLAGQAEAVREEYPAFRYEIVVGDDGSTDQSVIMDNREIDSLPHCRYVERERNEGRAAIRNFLTQGARYGWLLFVDCDMVVRDALYLRRYVEDGSTEVTYGGYVVNAPADGILRHNLRYLYESGYKGNAQAKDRQGDPWRNFHTSNFLVRRDIMLAFPLDERLRRYGYEDVLWGKTLKERGIPITHIDNPLSFEKFETNAQFVAKTEEGLATLAQLGSELTGYSSLLSLVGRLDAWRLTPLVRLFHRIAGDAVRGNLVGERPCAWLFGVWKLGVFCTIK